MNESYFTRQTLLERVKDKGDDQAWEEFLTLYKSYIYAIIRAMNIAPHDADDIMQQLSIKLWNSLQDYDYEPARGRFRNWVSVVTKNEVITFMRKRKRELNAMEAAAQEKETLYLDEIRLPEIEVIAEQEWKVFVTNLALKNVKENFSEQVFSAFTQSLDGMSPAEIAGANKMPRDTVYKYISRVKACFIEEIKNLKSKLDD